MFIIPKMQGALALFSTIAMNSSDLISGVQYHPADSLTDSQKVYVDTLVKKAYDNWINVVEYDGKALSSFKQDAQVEELFSEDEIRMRSHEMLENDGMQHYLLGLFSIGAKQPSHHGST